MNRILARVVNGWMSFYSGTLNKELMSLQSDVTGVANWNLFQSMLINSPELMYGKFDDFSPGGLVSSTSLAGFSTTVVSSGTLVMADAAGGVLQLTPGGTEDHGVQIQTNGEMFLPAATKDIWFECRVRGNDVTEVDWFLGLCTTDTSIIASNPNDAIGFWTHDGDVNIDFEVADGTGTPTDTTSDLANNTWVRLGFYVNGVTSVTPYINGTAGTAVTANIPAVEMALSFACTTGEGSVNTLDIDWYKIVQLR